MNNTITNYAGQLLLNATCEQLINIADKVAAYAKTLDDIKFDDYLGAFTNIFDMQNDGVILVNYYLFSDEDGCYDMNETSNPEIAQFVGVVFDDICLSTDLVKAIVNHFENSGIFTEIDVDTDNDGTSFFAKIK